MRLLLAIGLFFIIGCSKLEQPTFDFTVDQSMDIGLLKELLAKNGISFAEKSGRVLVISESDADKVVAIINEPEYLQGFGIYEEMYTHRPNPMFIPAWKEVLAKNDIAFEVKNDSEELVFIFESAEDSESASKLLEAVVNEHFSNQSK
ncbi:MAG: hypothetical protein HWE16_00990 [Gammaproteobacteria bacterium]|nr:hypothetical protein [Gammaproteobacteria bacterium]